MTVTRPRREGSRTKAKRDRDVRPSRITRREASPSISRMSAGTGPTKARGGRQAGRRRAASNAAVRETGVVLGTGVRLGRTGSSSPAGLIELEAVVLGLLGRVGLRLRRRGAPVLVQLEPVVVRLDLPDRPGGRGGILAPAHERIERRFQPPPEAGHARAEDEQQDERPENDEKSGHAPIHDRSSFRSSAETANVSSDPFSL